MTSELGDRDNIPCVVPGNVADAWELKALRSYRAEPQDTRGVGVGVGVVFPIIIPTRRSIIVAAGGYPSVSELEIAGMKHQQVAGMVDPRAGVKNPIVGPPLHKPAAPVVWGCLDRALARQRSQL